MQLHLDIIMKILGNLEPGPDFWPLNFILLVTRHYIFTRAKKFGKLNIYHLQSILKKYFLNRKHSQNWKIVINSLRKYGPVGKISIKIFNISGINQI